MTDRSTPPLRAVRIAAKCPICTKPVEAAYQPFCSKRCADIDLGRWLKEGYSVPAEEVPDGDEGEERGPAGRGGGPSGQRA